MAIAGARRQFVAVGIDRTDIGSERRIDRVQHRHVDIAACSLTLAAEQLQVTPANVRIVNARFVNHDASKSLSFGDVAKGQKLVKAIPADVATLAVKDSTGFQEQRRRDRVARHDSGRSVDE